MGSGSGLWIGNFFQNFSIQIGVSLNKGVAVAVSPPLGDPILDLVMDREIVS